VTGFSKKKKDPHDKRGAEGCSKKPSEGKKPREDRAAAAVRITCGRIIWGEDRQVLSVLGWDQQSEAGQWRPWDAKGAVESKQRLNQAMHWRYDRGRRPEEKSSPGKGSLFDDI